ncbi:MAG: PsiF family protein [Rhodocyclaceae bacterium]|nr:PsiF family protein [Rhodocyclaceae bacterium]MDP1957885.1 PsiF family protein [Rhodocyclaceae bacterium]
MKKLLAAAVFVITSQFAFAPLVGAEEKARTPQQQRMADCNKEATGKKGDERKTFMKACLGGKPAAAQDGRTAQQEKKKACNADAGKKDLKGDARKAFMSDCLKG